MNESMNTEDFPKLGSVYRHHKHGDEYMVLLLGKHEATQEDLVVYCAKETKQVWVRPLVEFCPPRFVLVPPVPNPYQVPSSALVRAAVAKM